MPLPFRNDYNCFSRRDGDAGGFGLEVVGLEVGLEAVIVLLVVVDLEAGVIRPSWYILSSRVGELSVVINPGVTTNVLMGNWLDTTMKDNNVQNTSVKQALVCGFCATPLLPIAKVCTSELIL